MEQPVPSDRIEEAYEAWQGGGEPIASDPYVLVRQFKEAFFDGFKAGREGAMADLQELKEALELIAGAESLTASMCRNVARGALASLEGSD